MNFKTGDRVLLKTLKQVIDHYGSLQNVPWGINNSMKKLLGKQVTVKKCTNSMYTVRGYNNKKILLEEDGGSWSWHIELFNELDMTDKVHNEIKRLLL